MHKKQNTDQIIPFSFRGNSIRAIMLHGEPWFVAKDVCDVLGYTNASKAVGDHCKGVTKRYPLRTAGGVQEVRIIAEPDLYRLIVHSHLPAAVEFEAWIFEEVLPTLRKTGRYTIEPDLDDPCNRVGANRADIFHHRGPVSKSGLDIRYTMDLTKIALNPNPRTLDLVQRLTGVDMSDLVEEMEACCPAAPSNHDTLFAAWFNSRLVVDPHCSTTVAALYADLIDYCKTLETSFRRFPPSAKAMSQWLARNGFERRRPGGISTFYGIGTRP